MEDRQEVELVDAVSAYPEADDLPESDLEMVQYFLKTPLTKIQVDPITGYPVDVPKWLTVDIDIDPRVAMDLAVVEWAYHEYTHDINYAWEEMQPRVLRRLNRKYGIEDN